MLFIIICVYACMRDTFKILYIGPTCIYIYYVPATKLCNKYEFSLKMFRRTIKVFYITYTYIYIIRYGRV